MQNSGKRSATDLNLATVLINLNYNYCYIGVLFYMYALCAVSAVFVGFGVPSNLQGKKDLLKKEMVHTGL